MFIFSFIKKEVELIFKVKTFLQKHTCIRHDFLGSSYIMVSLHRGDFEIVGFDAGKNGLA